MFGTRLKSRASFRSINSYLRNCGFRPLKHSNIEVNSKKMGCCGFWEYVATGNILYVNTDMLPAPYGIILLRSAKDTSDYTGGANNYATTVEDFIYRATEIGKKGF